LTPLLSIVTGTYNRLPQLSRMMFSAIQQLPRLDYEFVIVDGGSTDGTLEWLRKREDVRLIEHGELRGAIKAFCEGARAAVGRYVLLANDDVYFKPYAILAAIAHLEQTPTCGAVAFADNRTSKMHGDGADFRTEGMGAISPFGAPTMVTYAQVGLFRREIGDEAGWWGDRDSIMSKARTYGGDNYLSSRIWEMGYTVDPVDGAVVVDDFTHDALRYKNAARGSVDSGLYYQRYPQGARIPQTHKRAVFEERLRILYCPVYEPGHPMSENVEYGIGHALRQWGHTIEIDYLNATHDLIALAQAWQPHVIITQIQGAGERFTAEHLRAIKDAAPQSIIVNWNGDAHEAGLIGDDVITLLREVDLQTTVNAKVLPVYERLGIPAAYWQICYKDPAGELPDMPAHDVVVQQNCYNERRTQMVISLRQLQGVNIGVYGNCRGAIGNTHYNFAAQTALNRNAKIVIGDTFPNTVGFVSNRMFQVLAAGGFLLNEHSPRLEDYTGLKAGVHYVEWMHLDDLLGKVRYFLAHADERQRIAEAGREYVRTEFSADAQVRKLFTELIPRLT
jgi:hypothetical protein